MAFPKGENVFFLNFQKIIICFNKVFIGFGSKCTVIYNLKINVWSMKVVRLFYFLNNFGLVILRNKGYDFLN